MRENSVPFKKYCCTRTVSLHGQHLWVGGPTRWCLVFCSSPRLFHLDTKHHCRLLNSVHRDCFVSRDKVYAGWRLTRRCLVFCSPSRLFHRDTKFTAIYPDLVPFNSFTVTLGFALIYRDWQKTRHRDADGT